MVPVVFYTWLVVSTIALVVYRRRKAAERKAAAGGPEAVRPPSTADPVPARSPTLPRPSAGSDDPLLGTRSASPVVPRDALRTGSEPHTSQSPDTDRAVGSSADRPDEANADRSERRGLFASSRPEAPRTIAEALSGVSWPCGLVPVIRPEDIHQVDRRVVFSTVGVPAAEVGRQVADRLEEAGFVVSSLDEVTALARRDGTNVAMVLHPVAEKVLNDGRPEFPTLPPESVVLVCDLRVGDL